VVPAYNEERSLSRCIGRVLSIADETLELEVLIVDDASTDRTLEQAAALERQHPQIRVLRHEANQGKGAALRTGFRQATGDFVAVQDADLEYDPQDLKRLLQPLIEGSADVVVGSRFLSSGTHRVLYFWHSIGNRFLTLLSNMFTDLNLTDMETCYKVFRRDVLQRIELAEDRFGFEPEVIAKLARMRVRIYEMGVSYAGRTYEEGKKIGVKDGVRALYCIVRYNMPHAPMPIQFGGYVLVGGLCAIVNVVLFMAFSAVTSTWIAAAMAFLLAAVLNYWLCIILLFRRGTKWSTWGEISAYGALVAAIGAIDAFTTVALIKAGTPSIVAKTLASAIALIFNFLGRRLLIFPERPSSDWAASNVAESGRTAAALPHDSLRGSR